MARSITFPSAGGAAFKLCAKLARILLFMTGTDCRVCSADTIATHITCMLSWGAAGFWLSSPEEAFVCQRLLTMCMGSLLVFIPTCEDTLV